VRGQTLFEKRNANNLETGRAELGGGSCEEKRKALSARDHKTTGGQPASGRVEIKVR